MRGEIFRACLEIITEAAEGGVCRAEEAWRMTPGELHLAVRARRRAEVRRMKDMDMLAWLVGQYAAVGMNAPGRYPRQPDRVRERAADDDGMRRMMERIAMRGRREAED